MGAPVLALAAWQASDMATGFRWWKWGRRGKPRRGQGGRGWVLGFVSRCLQNLRWVGVGCQPKTPGSLHRAAASHQLPSPLERRLK